MIIIIICIENNNQLQDKINDSFNFKGEKMRLLSLIAIMFIIVWSTFADGHGVVNVYSARHYDSDVQLYEKFTAKTGIKVNVVSGKSGAIEKE